MCNRLRPHQLDYDWRFTERTAYELKSLIRDSRSLLIGCPTVAESLGGWGDDSALVDRQPAVTCRYSGKVIQADVREDSAALPVGGAFETIIFDSPWYQEDLLIWLDLALGQSRLGTRIYFSLWPDSTRPTAAIESSYVLNQLGAKGQITRHSGVLFYETPGFEHISMPEAGDEWRTGDLICVEVEDPGPMGAWKRKLRHSWDRFAFDDFQVALHVSDRRVSRPSISRVFRSWTLPSVSRRQIGLDRIQIWTSENRVGSITGGKHFYQALRALVRNEETSLNGENREALQLMRDNDFIPTKIGSRRLEWRQYD